MENKNREKMLFIAVAVAVGLLAVNYIIINPLTASWKDRDTRINDLRNKISDGHSLLGEAKSIEDRWNQMSTNTLPPNPTLAESQLFKSFQAWALSSRINLVGQKPQPKESDDPLYSNEEWHADAIGSLDQIFSFLYSVESSPMGLKMDSVELTARDDRGFQLALGLTVSGLILNPPTNSVP